MEKWRLIRDTFNKDGLKKTLLEGMLWNSPSQPIISINVDGEVIEVHVLAELPGAAFLQVESPLPDATSWFKKVDRELAKWFPERLVRFQHKDEDSWFWPRKLSSGSLSYERLTSNHNGIPDFLAQRLAGLAFGQKDHQTPGLINPVVVKEKIRGQFETGKVTNDFFKEFKQKHELLSGEIEGIENPEEASSYSTLMLNRLMFIYFLQKKEFLNGDPNYLRTCLQKVQSLKGEDKFYSFYKDYLLELFFNKLDNQEGIISDPEIQAIAGDIPYVNGGVFSKSKAESVYEIDIPDSAFEEIFAFFDSYTWHLDTRPTGRPNEINPEVIGYIFEQYINFTAEGKKENGAYYTKHDVTGFMVAQTLIPRIFEEVIRVGINPFALLSESPNDYIYESLQHGWCTDRSAWKEIKKELVECWNGDPTGWSLLDNTERDPEVCLPGETWVEVFARRERVAGLREMLIRGEVKEVNQIITLNLNSERLLADVISWIQDKTQLENLWLKVSGLRVIDPTCGSGAFLFAALEVLEVFYGNLLERLESIGVGSEVLEEMAKHPNRRYFLRKHSAIRNLFGVDIMADAIETAKLRIFLALASCLERKSDLEPLPDLDFNLKVGNLVVGFKNSDDVSRVDDGRLLVENRLANIEKSMDDHLKLHEQFLSSSVDNGSGNYKKKVELLESERALRSAADSYYAECTGKESEEYKVWSEKVLPFHWSIEFPAVFANGGFDVVIGNPPYISRKAFDKSLLPDIVGYRTTNFRDFYAVCFERSLQLLKADGRISLIVMLSLSFGDTNRDLRQLVADRSVAEWWSTFGLWPKGLFSGAGVRNTILSLGPGSGVNTTHHHIFNDSIRRWMFEGIRFTPTTREGGDSLVRGGLPQDLAEAMSQAKTSLEPKSIQKVYYRPTANYWVPVFPQRPDYYDRNGTVLGKDERVNELSLGDQESKEIALLVLAGKLGFLFWSAIGDDFDVNERELTAPRRLVQSSGYSEELRVLASKTLQATGQATVRNAYAGKVFINIRWASLREYTDLFDRALLEHVGLLDQWRPLNVWYRQVMRSNDSKSEAGLLDRPEAARLWGLEIN